MTKDSDTGKLLRLSNVVWEDVELGFLIPISLRVMGSGNVVLFDARF